MSTKLGSFEILSELSKSPTSTVYKANDESGQTIALKAIQLSAFGENAAALVAEMAESGVLCADLSPRTVRFVTHLDAGEEAVSAAVERLQPLLQ